MRPKKMGNGPAYLYYPMVTSGKEVLVQYYYKTAAEE
jgi:hypothetical protein